MLINIGASVRPGVRLGAAPVVSKHLRLPQHQVHRLFLQVWRVLVLAQDPLDHQSQFGPHTLTLGPVHRQVLAQVLGQLMGNLLEGFVGQFSDR